MSDAPERVAELLRECLCDPEVNAAPCFNCAVRSLIEREEAENVRLAKALVLGAAIIARIKHRIDPADTGLLRMVHEYLDALEANHE